MKLEKALKLESCGKRNQKTSPLCWIYKNTYSIHLAHLFSLFGKGNVKTIIFEEWLENKIIIEKDLMDFLELDKYTYDYSLPRHNSGETIAKKYSRSHPIFNLFKKKTYKKMTPTLYEIIKYYTYEDVEVVENMLGRNLDIWKIH